MALIRHIASQFDLVYLRPTTLARAVRELAPVPPYNPQSSKAQQYKRVEGDRRSGTDRRQHNRQVMLDMRSSYPRRSRTSRRNCEGKTISIDVYA